MFDMLILFFISCVIIIAFIVHLVRRKAAKIYFEDIPVCIIKDKASLIDAINQLSSYNPQFVGFDCEWKSNTIRGKAQNKICLIQIGHKELIVLIRIHLFSDNLPMELISFLNNIRIIKCGVGIYGDVKKLKHDYNIDVCGVVDINHIYENDHYFGLEKLSKQLLNKPMQYKHNINHTKWESVTLSTQQIYYASDDAMVAYHVFKYIIQTEHNNSDIMEICFGKMDINSNKSKPKNSTNTKLKHKKQKRSQSNITFKSDKNDMITLVSVNNEFLTIMLQKTGKQYIKKKWAKKVSMDTIKMRFEVHPINIYHNNLVQYQRVITLMDYKCMICGEDKEDQLMCFFIVYRYLYKLYPKSAADPYKVLICKTCNKQAVKWIHKYHEEILCKYLCNSATFKEIEQLYKMRNICYNLKHKKKLFRYSVEEQNDFVEEILKYCNIDEDIRKNVCIKEWHFNSELNIDWWLSNDYNYIIIRECIHKICEERRRRKHETNCWIRDSMLAIFKNKYIEFCEMFRKSFMDTMKPKYFNAKYPAFEFYVEHNVNHVNKQCKHKIIDRNGALLTLTNVSFIRNYIQKQVQINRINNTMIQLLSDAKCINYNSLQKASFVWIAFKEIECFICGKMEAYDNDCKLQLYHVFPVYFYPILFDDTANDPHINNMQSYVPLCKHCERECKRRENEFEASLYLHHDIVQLSKENQALFYALKLSQRSERYSLSVTEQNECMFKILEHCNLSFDDIEMIKEYHCNKEMDLDWFYMKQYDYIIMRECINKCIHLKQQVHRYKLSQMFKENKLQFIQLWIKHFSLYSKRLHISSFQI